MEASLQGSVVTCRAPGKAREVKIVALNRNAVVLGLLTVGIILMWQTRALLTLAVAVAVGEGPHSCSPLAIALQT